MVLRPPAPPRRQARPGPGPAGSAGPAAGQVVPYDHAASFPITGRPGTVVQDVINVSPDGVFVAVAIGYGFEQVRTEPLALLPVVRERQETAVLPGDLTLGDFPPSALLEGFRLNPRYAPLVFAGPANGAGTPVVGGPRPGEFTDQPVPPHLLYQDHGPTLFERVNAPAEVFFLLSIVDSASGRELQDRPSHNLASLGIGTGHRPFRLLAHPVAFMPRSTIRIQIIEQSQDVAGTLFVVLYGYKLLGASHCPEPLMRRLTGPPACPVDTVGNPSDRIIPFDYVTSLELTGEPGNQVENEVTVNVEGGFVATSVGYGLHVPEARVRLDGARVGGLQAAEVRTGVQRWLDEQDDWTRLTAWLGRIQSDPQATRPGGLKSERFQRWSASPTTELPLPLVDLERLPLRLLPRTALLEGLRLRPSHLRVAFAGAGRLAGELPAPWLDDMFERLNRPEDVSFRYVIFDGGRGRELQNQPIHNLAGLGSADGQRPFKRLARPLVFLPRSTIRVRVEERFGRGTLHVVFQGYKVLNRARGKGGL